MTVARVSAVGTPSAYGLFPAEDFRIATGASVDCATIPQARWFFSTETVAVPRPGRPIAGFEPLLPTMDDLQRWSALTPPGSAREYPGLVWIGAPHVIEQARLDASAEFLLTPDGIGEFCLTPRLASNRSFYNADSATFFRQREFRLRGRAETTRDVGPEANRFVARTLWPLDFRLAPEAPQAPIEAAPRALRDFVRSEPQGGAQSAFSTRVIWRRRAGKPPHRAGRPLIGLMLNGAQGDDDEAHGGHFALVTGRVGPHGQMHDWLVANYYTLESESEKGIIAAMLPMENYLADLNSGQAWYRPSCMLVATLREERTAIHLESALARVFNHFYRGRLVYQHAVTNCTGISISALRTIGWNIPVLGATNWWKAIVALPVVAARARSLSKGKAMFDYLAEDQTRLFPAVAFEQTGADLLRLVSGKLNRALTPYETMLRQDVEEIILVRIPQLPSSRAWGDYPVASVDEYRRRLPRDPARQQIVPVGPRQFPPDLRDPNAPNRAFLPSDYAVAAYAVALLLCAGAIVYGLYRTFGER